METNTAACLIQGIVIGIVANTVGLVVALVIGSKYLLGKLDEYRDRRNGVLR